MARATALSLLALFLLAAPVGAKTYRWVDAGGVVNYSDRPPQIEPVVGERDALIDEALTLSGIRKQIESLPAQMRAGVDLSQSPMPEKDRATVVKILGGAFRSGPILTTVRTALQKGYDPLQMGLLLAQLRTPVARKMAERETVTAEPAFAQNLLAYAATLKTAPPAPERVARLAKLDAVSGATDLSLEMRSMVVAAVLKAQGSRLPPEKRLEPARAEAMARELVGQQRDAARQDMLVVLLYAYRDATDEELDEYTALEGSDSSQWFQEIYRKALVEALATATETAVRQVAESLATKPR